MIQLLTLVLFSSSHLSNINLKFDDKLHISTLTASIKLIICKLIKAGPHTESNVVYSEAATVGAL